MYGTGIFRIAPVLMIAIICIAGSASAMSIAAGTQTASNAVYPVCTAPCECISEYEAATRWGAEGYEMCSKSICGQTADAMLQFYCIHQKGGAVAQAPVTSPPSPVAETIVQPTTLQAPVTSAAPAASITGSSAPPAPVPTKSPVGAAIILSVICAVLWAAARTRKG